MEKRIVLISLLVVVAGILVMIFAYEQIFMMAPLQRSFADLWDDFADTREEMATTAEKLDRDEWAQEYREYARADRDWARRDRDWARATVIAGYLFGAVGAGIISSGIGLGVVCWKSRHNETKI